MTHPILTRLREETRPQHEAAEAALNLMRDDLSRDEYQHVLIKFHGVYRPLEASLAKLPWSAHGIDHAARLKRPALDSDLRTLGIDDPDVLPVCPGTPAPRTIDEGFGCLYVLEGATLGGRIIAPHIERVLGLTPDDGIRFFSGYGTDTGAMWQAFREALTTHATDNPRDDQIVQSAAATFTALLHWLQK